MSLTEEVIKEMKERGYIFQYTKSFYEDYNSVSYILVNKGTQKLFTRTSYCSCNGLYDETSHSVIKYLEPLTLENINKYKEAMYIQKDKQLRFLNQLLSTQGFAITQKVDIELWLKEGDTYTVIDNNGELELSLIDP